MEKLKLVRERGSKLAVGFRFQPTEEEMVFQYLSRKTFSHPLPALVIPDFNVFTSDPWDLPGDGEANRYFFCNKEGNIGYGRKMGIATDSGFWKATTSSVKRIIYSKKMPIIGIRKSYIFHRSTKHCRAVRTDWIVHEYNLALSGNAHSHNSQGSLVRIGNWALCHIYLKKRVINATNVEDDDADFRAYDFLSDSYSSSASSSDSVILNDVSSS